MKFRMQSKTPEGGNYVPFGRLAFGSICAASLHANDVAVAGGSISNA